MQVFRLSQTRYAQDVTGEGARLFGGRWNLPMVSCLYTSQSRALAVLEYGVNVNIYEIPRALSLITYQLDEKEVHEVSIAEMRGNWQDNTMPIQTQEFGTRLFLEEKYPVVKIPSTVIIDEYNFLINPLYQTSLKIVDIRDFIFDVRIKLK